MSTVRSNSILVFFVAILLITPSQSQSLSFASFYRFRNLFSLAHSVFTGVAKLRAARGDVAGANRAKAIAHSLDSVTGFGFLKFVWSAWTWTWKDLSLTNLYGAVSDINELLRDLNELTRLESVSEKTVWLSRNYGNILTLTKSLSRNLLNAFGQSDGVREIVEILRPEVVEGGIIRDCLLLVNNDVKDLIQVLKDLLLQFFPATDKDSEL